MFLLEDLFVLQLFICEAWHIATYDINGHVTHSDYLIVCETFNQFGKTSDAITLAESKSEWIFCLDKVFLPINSPLLQEKKYSLNFHHCITISFYGPSGRNYSKIQAGVQIFLFAR